jgi:hypothetical protein
MSKPGESVTLSAPVVVASAPTYSYPTEPTPSRALGNMLRHLKGVMAAAEELRTLLEKQEQKEK